VAAWAGCGCGAWYWSRFGCEDAGGVTDEICDGQAGGASPKPPPVEPVTGGQDNGQAAVLGLSAALPNAGGDTESSTAPLGCAAAVAALGSASSGGQGDFAAQTLSAYCKAH
jgi:hypothetical protein